MRVKEYFDLLVKTSEEGGFPSVHGIYSTCKYRNECGRKCAIGILIPDSEYRSELENNGVLELFDYNLLKGDETWIPTKDGVRLTSEELNSVQLTHDLMSWQFGGRWDHFAFVNKLADLKIFQNTGDE